jgi:hypothetical protein
VANYSAVIDLRVQGQEGLRTVTDRLESINRLTKQIKPIPSLFDARAGAEITAAKKDLAALVKAYADGKSTTAKYATSLAGLNQQITAFRTVAANATTKSDEFNNSLKAGEIASRKLLSAELDRLSALQNIYTRQPTGGLTANDQGPSKMVKDLLSLNRQVPSSISGLNAFQRELREVQELVSMNSVDFRELEQAIYKVDVALGKVQFGPQAPAVQGPALPANFIPSKAKTKTKSGPAAGSLGFNPNPSAENLALGAGFPLLFGGGPAQVTGGLVGSMFGSGFGGQILGAALAQQLSDALTRIKEIGAAAKSLNMDSLRESVVYVNAQLDDSVRLLIEAGRAEEARALATEEAARQLSITPEVMQDINNVTNALSAEWEKLTGTFTASLGILGAPFAAALSGIVSEVNLLLTGFNTIATFLADIVKGATEWALEITGLKGFVDSIGKSYGRISEEQAKLIATLSSEVDASMRQLGVQKQILDLEAKRTTGYTQRDRLVNLEIDRQQKVADIQAAAEEQKIALRKQYASITDAAGQQELNVRLKQVDAEARMNIQTADINTKRQVELELLNKVYVQEERRISALKQQQDLLQANIDTLSAVGSITGARIGAEQQLNLLTKTRLEREYEFATTATKRIQIAIRIAKVEAEGAALAYQQALANIDLEVEKNRLQLQRSVLKGYEIVAEGKLQILQAKTAEEEVKKRQALNEAITAQNAVIRGAAEQVASSQIIAEYQKQSAGYQYQVSVATADTALQQKLVGQGIEMSSRSARNLADQSLRGYTGIDAMNNIASNLNAKMQNSAVALKQGTQAILSTTTQFSAVSEQATERQTTLTAATYENIKAQSQAVLAEQTTASAAKAAEVVKTTAYSNAAKSAVEANKTIVKSNGFSTELLRSNWAVVLGKIQGLYAGFLRGLIGNLNKAIGGINSLISNYNSLPTPPFPDIRQLSYISVPGYAEGGLVTRPTLAMVGEGGEPEYIIPQSKMATAASNYLSGSRGAGIMEGSGGDSTVINVQTGPVMEMNGERYVTMADFERGLRQVAGNVYKGLRTPAGRYAVGVP